MGIITASQFAGVQISLNCNSKYTEVLEVSMMRMDKWEVWTTWQAHYIHAHRGSRTNNQKFTRKEE